jgi:hypothetical protein
MLPALMLSLLSPSDGDTLLPPLQLAAGVAVAGRRSCHALKSLGGSHTSLTPLPPLVSPVLLLLLPVALWLLLFVLLKG